MLRDIADLLQTQLAREHHAAAAQLRRRLRSGEIVHAHLRARVQRQVRQRLVQHTQQSQILHQHGVRPQLGGAPGKVHRLRHLPVAHKGVHRYVHLAAPDAAIAHGLGKFLIREIIRAPTGVVGPEAQINRVRPVLHRRDDGVGTSGGRKQFQHSFPDLYARKRPDQQLRIHLKIQGTLYKIISGVSTARGSRGALFLGQFG